MSKNIVLLCLDTVRYDQFDRFADHLQPTVDLSFEECRTASTWSVPSHTSMFTGTLPHEHGFHSATPSFGSLDRDETFLSELDQFRHVGVSANPYASPIFGFDHLFDEFYHVTSSMLYPQGLSASEFWHQSSTNGWRRYLEFAQSCLAHEHPVKSLANGTASQVNEVFQTLPIAKPFDDGCNRILSRTRHVLADSEDPTFVFANIMDAHGPLTHVRGYDGSLISPENRGKTPGLNALSMNMDDTFDDHEAEIAAYRELYAAAVEYTVRQVAQFCASVDDDTTVIITSDHGEQLDDTHDRRRFGHVTPDMTEQLLHVPLAVVNANFSVDESKFVSHLDLGNLITAIASGGQFEPTASLAAEVAGLGVAHPPRDHEDFDRWNRVSRCVYTHDGGDKYVWDSLDEARHCTRENGEYVLLKELDRSGVPTDITNVFSNEITTVETDHRADEINGGVESQLEELGYL